MKKRGLSLLLIVLMVMGTCGIAFAQSSTNMTINAIIMSPIQVSMVSGLDFGRIFKGAVATTVDPAAPAAGTTPASFQVTGELNTGFQVLLPAAATISDGTTTLNVTAFTSTLAGGAGVLDASGVASFKVGATLDAIPTTATSGTYTGTVTVTVAYTF